jgi:hypothetical protein
MTALDTLAGRTIRWRFADGPTAGITFEHDLHADGTIVWRAVDGAWKGASKQEPSYAAVRVADHVHVLSYLAASGHTLTVALNLETKEMVGFASNEKEWQIQRGTFEILG